MDKVLENRLRRQAKRLGLALVKSRARRVHMDNLGGYRLIDPTTNFLVAGQRFDLTLEDVAAWLDDYERSIKEGKPHV